MFKIAFAGELQKKSFINLCIFQPHFLLKNPNLTLLIKDM
jgi:hypothetical protein